MALLRPSGFSPWCKKDRDIPCSGNTSLSQDAFSGDVTQGSDSIDQTADSEIGDLQATDSVATQSDTDGSLGSETDRESLVDNSTPELGGSASRATWSVTMARSRRSNPILKARCRSMEPPGTACGPSRSRSPTECFQYWVGSTRPRHCNRPRRPTRRIHRARAYCCQPKTLCPFPILTSHPYRTELQPSPWLVSRQSPNQLFDRWSRSCVTSPLNASCDKDVLPLHGMSLFLLHHGGKFPKASEGHLELSHVDTVHSQTRPERVKRSPIAVQGATDDHTALSREHN